MLLGLTTRERERERERLREREDKKEKRKKRSPRFEVLRYEFKVHGFILFFFFLVISFVKFMVMLGLNFTRT